MRDYNTSIILALSTGRRPGRAVGYHGAAYPLPFISPKPPPRSSGPVYILILKKALWIGRARG
ncbi:unnamed protein product [Tuber melanosporum]|uniref:(Perigord truffle) hypothetical protein n=1 Tax=Tuber melanosporum (strain Mel28) TaxID=656061 RepID=D5GD15_TUBMM|nr:uncharacterized protein GSTUM_00000932001 [Tuber melanosporum]CAZ82408.1 unnamed protein product [Tuber melanosporum]